MNRTASNLLRFSGIIYGVVGSFHVLRYFFKWTLRVGGFELTLLGSLLIGCFLLLLSVSCFMQAKK